MFMGDPCERTVFLCLWYEPYCPETEGRASLYLEQPSSTAKSLSLAGGGGSSTRDRGCA